MTAEFPLAVHALVFLYHKAELVPSRELAKNICTNPARVRKVMGKLCHAGLLEVRRGQGSGYLSKGEGELTLAEILLALHEEPVSMNWRSGDMEEDCLISSGMGALMDGLYSGMNRSCMEYLSSVTIRELSERIFMGKASGNAGKSAAEKTADQMTEEQ